MLEQFNGDKWLKKLELEPFPEPEFINLKNPVLLCHGYGALASIVKPSPLYDVAMLIRKHGTPAFAPNIVPYATIETRAEEWVVLIDELSKRFNYDSFNIIAHSMGGLDMRYAIAKLGIHEYVSSFTSVATPHHGASLAEFVLKTPELLQGKLSEFVDWMGDIMYPKRKSDVVGSLKQLTRSFVINEFNPAIPDHENIPYYSYSAAVGPGTDQPIERIFRFQHGQIFDIEGINDGFVSVESAKWGKHIKTAPLSHFEQMNLRTSKERKPLVRNFWKEVLNMLAEHGH